MLKTQDKYTKPKNLLLTSPSYYYNICASQEDGLRGIQSPDLQRQSDMYFEPRQLTSHPQPQH